MPSTKPSISVRLLGWLANAVYSNPRAFFYSQILLSVLCVYYTVARLEFSTSRNDLVGADKKYHHIFLEYEKEFSAQSDLVAIIESEDKEKNRQFVERLGAKLESDTNHFADVFYKGDLKMMGPKALLFLPEKTLDDLQSTLQSYRPFIENFAEATNLNSLFRKVNQQFRTAKQEDSSENRSMVTALPALTRLVTQASDSLNRPGTPPSPGITALFNAESEAEEQQYYTFAKGQIYLVSARPRLEEESASSIRQLRALVQQTQMEVPGVNVGITGEKVLELDEMAQAEHDSTIATVVSLMLVALIFVVSYKETGRPMKATISLIIGLCFTMGFTTFAIGHLNILTITFLPILIGLAIDFGVHLISRYEEELRNGKDERESLEKAIVNTGQGIFTGCFTTAGAFFAMGLTDFKGIQEMGIISGAGMLLCLIPMMTFLPALLLRGRQNALDHKQTISDKRAQLEKLWLERPAWAVGITIIITVLALTQFRKIHFDYNLLNMQSAGLPAVVFQRKLIDEASKSVLFAAVMTDSLQKAVQLESQLTNLPVVSTVESMSRFLAEDQTAKLKMIGEIKRDLQSIQFAEIDTEPANLSEINQTLFYTQGYLGLAATMVQKEGETNLYRELRDLREAIGDLRNQLSSGNPARTGAKLSAFQRALFQDIHGTFDALKNQDNSSPLRVEDLPLTLRNRFIGKTGKHLLQVYPRENVWQREPQEEFVKQVRRVDPNATGTPVQLYEYTTLLKESYEQAAWYALGAIAILVFIHFRKLSSVVLALLPVGLGVVWMVGFMGWLGVPFNPANIMTLPLAIGIGVTNGIHILNRYSEEQNPSILAKSTGKAVLVSGLTTIAGFGSLVPAKHQGIASLGIVMATGVATCMIAALVFLPALLNLMRPKETRRPSGNNAPSPLGLEEPR